jgi:hypothetical protein
MFRHGLAPRAPSNWAWLCPFAYALLLMLYFAQIRAVECCSSPGHAHALERALAAGAARVSTAADCLVRLEGDERIMRCRNALRKAALAVVAAARPSEPALLGAAVASAEGTGVDVASPRRPGRPAWAAPTEWTWAAVPMGSQRCDDMAAQAVRCCCFPLL